MNEKNTRRAMSVIVTDLIYKLQVLNNSLNDSATDLVDIGLELYRLDREYRQLNDLLNNCYEY